MFQKLLTWLKEVFSKMLNRNDVQKIVNVDVAVSPEMSSAMEQWRRIYANDSPWLSTDVKSLNLGVAISSEIARLVTIEMKAEITGSPRADYLQTMIEGVVDALREETEEGNAIGGMVFKPYVDGNQINVDYVPQDSLFPIAFDGNGVMTSVVFVDQRTVGQNYYTRFEYHKLGDVYTITNMAFKSSTRDTIGNRVPLSAIDDWADLEEEVTITGVKVPLFGYYRFPIKNNVDTNSPLGASCFSRATDTENGGLIRQADEQWSNFLWENESAKRALYTDVTAFDQDADGNPVLPNKRLYRTLKNMAGTSIEQKNLFDEWSPDIREESLLNGLDAILKRIEFNCGLAYGTLSNPESVDKTATEMKISRQRTYATVTDTQKSLQKALEQLLAAMDIYATLYNLAPAGAYSPVFTFDDSVIVDKDTQFANDLKLKNSSIMSRVEFRMRNFGEDEETARKMIAMVDEEQQVDLFSEGV